MAIGKRKRLEVKEIPVPPNKHPPPPDPVLLKHEFTVGVIAPKGSGKTTWLMNLINFYKGYFHKIIVFSPTVKNDDKWDWLKKQRLLVENKPLKLWIKKEKQRRTENLIVKAPPRANDFQGLVDDVDEQFDGLIPEDCFYEDYSDEDLGALLNELHQMITLLKKHGKSKYFADRVLFVFDDLVGSSLFGNQRDNLFKMFNVKHRHYGASAIEVSQGYKEIPKTIRTGWSALILFDIPNDKELEVIFEEFSMGMTKKQWYESYNHCVSQDYGFMYLNFQREKKLRVMKNFEKVLFFEQEKCMGDAGPSIKELKGGV